MYKKGTKTMLSAVLSAGLLISSLPVGAFAEESDMTITELNLGYDPPVCGQHYDPTADSAPFCVSDSWDDDEPHAEMVGSPVWVTAYNSSEPYGYTAFDGDFVGGEKYTAFFELKTNKGYSFDESIAVNLCDYYTWDDHECVPLSVEPHRLVIAYECEAVHDWDEDRTERTEPTCVSEGSETKYCRADGTHIVTTVLPVDENAHSWGEWETVTEADPLHEGKKRRTCGLCGKTEEAVIPKYVMPYTKVYEPQTSWAMSATIAWRADETALNIASADVRPATCFVWLDSSLSVYDRNGGLVSSDFDSYVRSTTKGMIPAFYISDKETAEALKSHIRALGLADCFVVSTPENKDLVKDVADLLYVRGMIDCSDRKELSRKDITDMIAAVNGAHGKTLIISEEAATKENIALMQSLAATVWVRTSDSTGSIMRACTRGANGIVCDDYKAAVKCEEFFADDAPALLRTPLIIGHRGDPSVYVENTLDSAKGAFAEGVDSVENDIHLTTDGELFILHDDYLSRLMMVEDTECESLTLDELRALPFKWERIVTDNEIPADKSRDGKLYGQDEQKEYVVPTLREYIEAFKGTGLVHDTEIKSFDPAIIPVFKAMVDEYDAWDQFFCITFNEDILDALYRDYPEISIGALLFPVDGRMLPYMPEFGDYQRIENESGAEEALKTLYSALDRWNATYAPASFNFGDKTVEIGRHRGLTTWTWTYADNDTFARDYLRGLNGMTTDFAWKTSELIESISSADAAAKDESDIPKPTAVLRSGESKALDTAELVKVEELDKDRSLMIWRYKADLTLGGESCGEYYLYSEPFVFTKETAENSDPVAVSPSGAASVESAGNAGAAAGGNSAGNADNAASSGASDSTADNAGQVPSENISSASTDGTAAENTPTANSAETSDRSPETGTDSAAAFGGLIACVLLVLFGRIKLSVNAR